MLGPHRSRALLWFAFSAGACTAINRLDELKGVTVDAPDAGQETGAGGTGANDGAASEGGGADSGLDVTTTDGSTATEGAAGGSGFTAYNDFAWAVGQLDTNITRFTTASGDSGLPSTGALIDYETGQPTPVFLAVSGGEYNGGTQSTQGAEPATGDAAVLFLGRVSALGAVSYVDDPNAVLVVTLVGLSPTKTYDLAFFAHRAQYGWDRASRVTLSGQVAFKNTSSVATDNPDANGGALFSGPSDPSTRLPADNPKGYVARFSNVDPGSDGAVALTVSFDGSVAEQYRGKYASALRVAEE